MWVLKDQLNKGSSSRKLRIRVSIAKLIEVLLNKYTDDGQGTSEKNFWAWFKDSKDKFPFDVKTAKDTFEFYRFLAAYPRFLKHRELLFSDWSRVSVNLLKWFNSDESKTLPSTSVYSSLHWKNAIVQPHNNFVPESDHSDTNMDVDVDENINHRETTYDKMDLDFENEIQSNYKATNHSSDDRGKEKLKEEADQVFSAFSNIFISRRRRDSGVGLSSPVSKSISTTLYKPYNIPRKH